jgi:c-di-GMP-binding flagellar brake protein YcgR
MELDEITPGCKINVLFESKTGDQNVKHDYPSSLYSVLDSKTIEIVTPLNNTTPVPLHPGSRYTLIFSTDKGMIKALSEAVDRYKKGNFLLVKMKIVGNLSKYQRREFYRIDCLIPVKVAKLDKADLNITNLEDLKRVVEDREEEDYATIIDISGGGIRITAPFDLHECEYCLLGFDLLLNSGSRHIDLIGKIVSSQHMPETDKYSHRIQFVFNYGTVYQEIIVRYIFETERKRRRKEQEV